MPNKGFTLFEVLISIAALAVVATLAPPTFNHFLQRLHLRGITHQLHASLNLARQAAITRRIPVVVRSKESNWNNGWTLFVDRNNDGQSGAGEEVLLVVDEVPHSVSLSSNFGHYARYDASGRSSHISGAFMAGTFLLCARTLPGTGQRLVMSVGGRVRSSQYVGSLCEG